MSTKYSSTFTGRYCANFSAAILIIWHVLSIIIKFFISFLHSSYLILHPFHKENYQCLKPYTSTTEYYMNEVLVNNHSACVTLSPFILKI
jgi:hypothetical protein